MDGDNTNNFLSSRALDAAQDRLDGRGSEDDDEGMTTVTVELDEPPATDEVKIQRLLKRQHSTFVDQLASEICLGKFSGVFVMERDCLPVIRDMIIAGNLFVLPCLFSTNPKRRRRRPTSQLTPPSLQGNFGLKMSRPGSRLLAVREPLGNGARTDGDATGARPGAQGQEGPRDPGGYAGRSLV